MEHKYSYTLNGKMYFGWFTQEEKEMMECKYGIFLTLVSD